MSDQVLITGASRGIGRAAAERFRKEGWRVINVSRSPCTVPDVVNVPVDLAVPGWEPAVEKALRDGAGQGRLSVIHNAALYEHDDALTMDADHLRRVLEVNVVAPLVLNRLARPLLTDGSSLLYVASTLGEKAVKGVASYVTTKHALIGMMRATCQDLAGTQVHTAAVCPGFTDTEMLREHLGADPAVRASVAGMTTFGRLINPEEIANVLYLCATTPVLNGAVIHANLGQIER
ncbi:SDR family oxidoreductase [Corallococcus sp. AB049A]|uniref:SDR family NAD(P)-dependent oxidoreductase n=1 Tax=Corallococcus sp. AB049A TaxID=2316721 RepID=UPI000EA20FBB|nr:SDR family oxidoreductase [Corallococcus sp. AB049A]RKH52112.1 SDR family oxidoreductase [Corallococcus sp. AB050B]RKI73535.1 SDR family oxidoreductase [Corallococcus sp. AB049A]